MFFVGWVLLLIVSYVIGSLPMGLICGKAIWNVDLRKRGSGNIGDTNAWRVLGKKAGILVFVLDFIKGEIPVLLALHFFASPWAMVIAGLTAIFGHAFSIFTKFDGGKAVATGLGALSVMMPKLAIIVFIIWAVIVYLTRYVSLASIVASILVPFFVAGFHYPRPYIFFGVFTAVLIILKHGPNIQRLINGTENRI